MAESASAARPCQIFDASHRMASESGSFTGVRLLSTRRVRNLDARGGEIRGGEKGSSAGAPHLARSLSRFSPRGRPWRRRFPRVAAPPRRFSRSRPVRSPVPPSSARGWREDTAAPEDGRRGVEEGEEDGETTVGGEEGQRRRVHRAARDGGPGPRQCAVRVRPHERRGRGGRRDNLRGARVVPRFPLRRGGDVITTCLRRPHRLLAHCPSLIAGQRVLEIGAGLGLAGNAAAKAGAAFGLMVDRDADMLALAKRSAVENAPPRPTRMCRVETRVATGPPSQRVVRGESPKVRRHAHPRRGRSVRRGEREARRGGGRRCAAMRVGTNRRRREGEGDCDEDRIGGGADDDARAPAMALVADPERREVARADLRRRREGRSASRTVEAESARAREHAPVAVHEGGARRRGVTRRAGHALFRPFTF